MSINYSTAVKNTRMTAVRDAIDAGAGPGKINLYTAGYAALLVSIALADPSGTIADGILTLSGMPKSGIGVASGDAAIAKIVDSNDGVVADGLTVGTVGANIIIDNVNIAVGQTVNLTSGSIVHG
jgi:hypothetical protein